MEQLRVTKVVRVGSSLAVIIPKALLCAVDFRRGDQVFLAVREDLSLEIKKLNIKTIS